MIADEYQRKVITRYSIEEQNIRQLQGRVAALRVVDARLGQLIRGEEDLLAVIQRIESARDNCQQVANGYVAIHHPDFIAYDERVRIYEQALTVLNTLSNSC